VFFLPTDLLYDVFIFASIYDVVRVSIIGTVKAAERTKKNPAVFVEFDAGKQLEELDIRDNRSVQLWL